MDVYQEIRLEFDVENLVDAVLKRNRASKSKQEIIDEIKRNYRDFITLP